MFRACEYTTCCGSRTYPRRPVRRGSHVWSSCGQVGFAILRRIPRSSRLEGLAVAIPWGFESPLPHQPKLDSASGAVAQSAGQTPRQIHPC
jgi:hypothetical protein